MPVYAEDIQLIVEDENITATAEPFILNNRMMVPISFIAKKLGGQVSWDPLNQVAAVQYKEDDIKFWINSPVYQLNDTYKINDVQAVIHNDRTYVPLKVIGQVFNADVQWHPDTSSVTVDLQEEKVKNQLEMMTIQNIQSGMTIEEKIKVQIDDQNISGDVLKLLLLDPTSMRGEVVDSGRKGDILTYTPRVGDNGNKVLVAAVYDESLNYLGGDVVSVNVQVKPKVTITGVTQSTYDTGIKIGQSVNFVPEYVTYQITDVSTGAITEVKNRDPWGTYTFTSSHAGSKAFKIQVLAVDEFGSTYGSDIKHVTMDLNEFLSIKGVTSSKIVDDTVSFIASRNFDVVDTKFYMIDSQSDQTTLLGQVPWGSFEWTPDESLDGYYGFYVTVIDTNGVTRTSSPVYTTVRKDPKIKLYGIGPNQVVTDAVDIQLTSNVQPSNIKYYINDQYVKSVNDISDTYEYVPNRSGQMSVYATATYNGQTLKTDTVNFKTYQGDLYGPKPIIIKDQFMDLVSELAVHSKEETGMAASLQVAQAILETGWGQKVPVDKYSGLFSFNLFGIKGEGTNGSVISNTWEVYNGKSFRVDAAFRAYNNVEESWLDHKKILLERSRYEPYREVMYDGVQGAYAIRRCGYATDPNYPMKLINIIKKYNLKALDEVGVLLK